MRPRMMRAMHPWPLLLVLLSTTLAAAERKPSGPPPDPGREARQRILHDKLLDHFCVGVDAPSDWLLETKQKNGCAWDFKVAYLSGGVGRGTIGWQKWVNWPEWYVGQCRDAGVGAWITWYMLSQSLPADYKPGPAQAAPANAKVAATMKDYFAQYKLFMIELGKQKPWPVVMQFEPDEWCHLLLSTPDFDPKSVDIKVGSCGIDELKDLPDNLYGYAAALKRIRDTYAPENVLLCCNPSAWRWQGQMSGQAMGEIMKKVCPDWELAVLETGDRDKGLSGKPPPYGTDISICQNLENHLQWITDFHKASGMWVVVWQAAMGNTYFATCDNTPGHECDNLTQMLFEDYPKNDTIARYVAAGCCGWMFNGGQAESTQVYDARKDGITNPKPIPGNLGNKAEYADDDGGYMRLRMGLYSKQPYPILAKEKLAEQARADAEAKRKEAEAARKAKADADAQKRADAEAAQQVLTLADTSALDVWEPKLKSRLRKAIAESGKARFPYGANHALCDVVAIDDQDQLTIAVPDVGKVSLAWSGLEYADLAALAVALSKGDEPSSNAIAAFYLLLANDRPKAERYLGLSGDYQQMVRSAFHLAAP
jgi:hypothetical protein